MRYYKLQRSAKDVAPVFKEGEETTQKVTGTLKGVFLNDAKEVEKRDGSGKVTIPANLNLVFEEDFSVQVNYELGGLFRTLSNSILSAELGSSIELYAFINNKGYKAINITNPNKEVEIELKDGEKIKVNEKFAWAYNLKTDVPEVEIIKNKKGEFVSADDSEANEFFITKLKEKFVEPNKKEKTSDSLEVGDSPF